MICLVDDGCHSDYGGQDADDIQCSEDAHDDNIVDEGHGPQAPGFVHPAFLVVASSLKGHTNADYSAVR